MMGNKNFVMRQKLGAIWEAFNRGEVVPRGLVVGPDSPGPSSLSMPQTVVDWDSPSAFRRAYYGPRFPDEQERKSRYVQP